MARSIFVHENVDASARVTGSRINQTARNLDLDLGRKTQDLSTFQRGNHTAMSPPNGVFFNCCGDAVSDSVFNHAGARGIQIRC
jgi:hypothetical protein